MTFDSLNGAHFDSFLQVKKGASLGIVLKCSLYPVYTTFMNTVMITVDKIMAHTVLCMSLMYI